jgi:hypothetical protein
LRGWALGSETRSGRPDPRRGDAGPRGDKPR